MKRHLRLVASSSCAIKTNKKQDFLEFGELLNRIFGNIFISRNEKIYILKDIITKLYRDYEISTGIIDEPYFIRAEKKIRRIIRENKVNYYYNLLKKYQEN